MLSPISKIFSIFSIPIQVFSPAFIEFRRCLILVLALGLRPHVGQIEAGPLAIVTVLLVAIVALVALRVDVHRTVVPVRVVVPLRRLSSRSWINSSLSSSFFSSSFYRKRPPLRLLVVIWASGEFEIISFFSCFSKSPFKGYN